MWASVDARGEIVSSHRVKSVGSSDRGIYEIAFEGNLEGCLLQATARGRDPVVVSVEANVEKGTDDLAVVHVFDMDSTPQSSAFDVAALCPGK